jgi:hypothetical protein
MSASATASAGLPQLSNKTLLIHTKEEPPAPVPNGYMPSVNGVTVGSLSQRELAEHILVCANAYKQMSENSVTTSACNSILHLAGLLQKLASSCKLSQAMVPAANVPPTPNHREVAPAARVSSPTATMRNRHQMSEDLTPKPRCQFWINPLWKPRLAWDTSMLVIVTIDCVLLPIELGFVDEFALSPGWFWFTTVYFCTDLVLNFFTAYFKDKQLVTQLHRIAWHYLTTWFLVDFVSSVPWVVIIPLFFGGGADTAQSMRVARITKLAKLARCLRLMRMPGVINMDMRSKDK